MSNLWLKPRYVVIIGNPIEIDSKSENRKYCSGKSDSRKICVGILIIYFTILFFMFVWSEIMFLGRGSKYNGKFRAADSKNLHKPLFFHHKTSKIIGFTWFSLSELPYSKSQQPTCLPRGQVAPQVHVSTATPPIGPRGEGGAAVATWGECNDLGKVAWKWSASPT